MKRKLEATVLIFLLMGGVFSAGAAWIEDFVPQESVLYLQLRDIDAVYSEIETSEVWQEAFASLPGDMDELQQGISLVQGALNTDPLSVLQTVGYRTVLSVWIGAEDAPHIGLVIHSGGNLGELQRFTKIVEGLIGMDSANTLQVDAGKYQQVRYNTLEGNVGSVKYGFVDEFLVLGIGESSFEKLVDTYRKRTPSIRKNETLSKFGKKIGMGEAVVFVDVHRVLPLIENLEEWARTRLPIFESVYVRLNLVEAGPLLRIAVRFDPKVPENEIGLFLKEGKRLESLKALSRADDLFVVVAPHILAGVWEIVFGELDRNGSGDAFAAISFIEGLLNLNLREDATKGLTGELALAVSDLTDFDPDALENLNFDFETFSLDAASVETSGGLIFRSSNPSKWTQVSNSLSNLQNTSVSQAVHNETPVSEMASNIYYSEVEDLFLLSFSEAQMHALVDEIKMDKLPGYLKQLPKSPIGFVQLNVARVLEMEHGAPPPPSEEGGISSDEIPLLLAWLSVKKDEAVLELVFSDKKPPLEVFAQLAPLLFWHLENQ